MTSTDLIKALAADLTPALAKDLTDNFMLIRQDVSSGTFRRPSPGKFVEAMVEDFAGKRLVLVDVSVKEEATIVLQTHHPSRTTLAVLTAAMDRRAGDTVRKTMREMWAARLVEGDSKSGYLLTAKGVAEAQ